MLQPAAAKRYAKALLELATAQGAEETVATELARVADVLSDPTLARLLALPTLSLQARRDIAHQLAVTLSLQPVLSNFLRVLAENDRLAALTAIYDAYQRLLEQAQGRVRAQVRTAAPLAQEELTRLIAAFSRLTAKTVTPTVTVDPELLGGVVVTIEGQVYDASLKTQLRRLRDSLAQQL